MDFVISNYDKANSDTINRLSNCLWKNVIKFLDKIENNDIFIDFGCGTGRYSKYLREQSSCEITCLDFSKSLLEISKDKIQHANFIKFDLRNGDFSNIPMYSKGICVAVIAHFKTPNERAYAVNGMLSRLLPGGTLLLSVWDFEKIKPEKFVNNDKLYPGDYEIKLENEIWFYHLYSTQGFKDFISQIINTSEYDLEFTNSKHNIFVKIQHSKKCP